MIHQIHIRTIRACEAWLSTFRQLPSSLAGAAQEKTNFASAIRFLRDYLAYGFGSVQQQYPACRCVTNPSGTMQFKVVFDVPGFPEQFTYRLHLGNQVNLIQAESLEYGSATIFKQAEERQGQGPQWQTPPALVSVPQPGAAALGRSPVLKRLSSRTRH